MLIYDDFSKKCHITFKKFWSHSKSFYCVFESFLSYLVCRSSFKSINSSCLSKKKYDGDNFTPTLCKQLRGQNASVGIGLIELTGPSDTFSCKLFFKYCILQTILQVFLLLIFVWNKIFCARNWVIFYTFLIWFGLTFGFIALKVLCYWCHFYKVIGN